MDMTFRESEPFYGEKTDLSSLFDFDSPSTIDASREGEIELVRTKEDEQSTVVVGSIPSPVSEERWTKPNEEENLSVHTRRQATSEERWRKPNEEENLKVYTRRKPQHEQQQQGPTAGDTQVQGEQHAPTSVEIVELTDGAGPSSTRDSMDLPIALRKGIRVGAKKPPNWYRDEHDIANYVSYTSLSTNYMAFIASLQSVEIPRDWKVAKQDPKWREAMIEELNALERNKTWELVHLPAGKRAVGCKWIYTVKQNPEGKIERYKARLVARGYSQAYGIDYDETFAPVAKMNTVRILISCATNFGWPLHQLDVKNAFLHGDLQEEVYMEIPPGFSTPRTSGKVCRLRKSLYGLKQSPRAWFDRFRRVVCGMGYKQCNGDHTVFYRHSNSQITILAVYVDDIIITGDDAVEISRLKDNLRKEFEVKDLGQLKYFLGIEIARSPEGIVLSQRKYVLDLLSDTGMLGCRVASTPIDQNHKLCAESGDPVDKEKYQKLVGRLIYLCHTRPDISYAVSIVSRYMHDPRSGHLDAVNQILRPLGESKRGGEVYRLYDVGGQRNERRKWIHLFEGVNAVIFCAAISEYDQMLFEDETQNRMMETKVLFDWVLKQRCFEKTSFMLFLNKFDIFEEKIQKVPLTVCEWFKDYQPLAPGKQEVEHAYEFVKKKFEELYFQSSKPDRVDRVFKIFRTTALDQKLVKKTFKLIDESMRRSREGA
uniref:Uncharacterized protein n=2 Tax=Avena sativa TaxID=4498 RepID=A0ACD6APZ5_AVESA